MFLFEGFFCLFCFSNQRDSLLRESVDEADLVLSKSHFYAHELNPFMMKSLSFFLPAWAAGLCVVAQLYVLGYPGLKWTTWPLVTRDFAMCLPPGLGAHLCGSWSPPPHPPGRPTAQTSPTPSSLVWLVWTRRRMMMCMNNLIRAATLPLLCLQTAWQRAISSTENNICCGALGRNPADSWHGGSVL